MRAMVVYESMYGDNMIIGEAISAGLLSAGVACLAYEVGQAPTSIARDIDLLVVGGPNHQFGMSRPASRASAAEETTAEIISGRIGIREWLGELTVQDAPLAVAFDTQMDQPKVLHIVDHAARSIAKGLLRAGCRSGGPEQHFYVQSTQGPLVPGEADRARSWGAQLARLLQ